MKTMTQPICWMLAALLLLATCAASFAAPEPGVDLFHVSVDNATEVGFGPYLGQPNPNFGRLTFLLSHTFVDRPWSNHFHRIGAYSYTGDPAAPVEAFSGNNRVPEPYQMDDGLSLFPGTGVFDGKLVSGLGPARTPGDEIEQEYGYVTVQPIDNLMSFDGLSHPDPTLEDPNPVVDGAKHPINYLINASGGAYKGTMAGVRVGLELVEVSDGLTLYDDTGAPIFGSVGEVITLGESTDWSFDPTFAVDGSSPLGASYSATFKLVDLSDTPQHGDSAPFSFDFVAVPEPSTAALMGMAVLGFARRLR